MIVPEQFFGVDQWDEDFSQNFRTQKEAGIINPSKVVRVGLENAVSIASVLLLTEGFAHSSAAALACRGTQELESKSQAPRSAILRPGFKLEQKG